MFLDLLKKRRSIRTFQDKTVEPEKIAKLLEAALRAPSSRGLSPWEFIVIQDQTTLARLATAKPHGAAFVKNAPLAIAVCADPQKCDVWIEDCSIAAIILHLAAADLGLGSCWVQIRLRDHESGQPSPEFAGNLLGLPSGMTVEALIVIGYPAVEKPGNPSSSLLPERLHAERFGIPFSAEG